MENIRIGNTVLDVMYAGVGPFVDRFKTQIYFRNYSLSELAAILDGAEEIEHTTSEKTELFEGYSRLTEISFVDGETVLAYLDKPEVTE